MVGDLKLTHQREEPRSQETKIQRKNTKENQVTKKKYKEEGTK